MGGAKMKAAELMVGNWVKRKTQPDGFVIDESSFTKIEDSNFDYQPIPISKQWLIAFGFKECGKHKDDIYYQLKISKLNDCWNATEYKKGNYCLYGYPHIKYIHQLQNLYFALTEKELMKSYDLMH